MEDKWMKTYRISALVLAVFCCMTLVIAAAGAIMVPDQGADPGQAGENFPGPGSGHGYDTGNVTDQGQRAVGGNLTSPGGRLHGPPPGNMTEINGTILEPYPGNGQGNETGNMTGLQSNFTRPPPVSMNRTWSGNATEGNLTGPPPGADHGPMQKNVTAPEDTMTKVLDQGMQQDSNNDFVEAFLALLRSYFNSGSKDT